LRAYQVRALADSIGVDRERLDDLASIALGLYRAFVDCDATLVEANPLVIGPDGGFCCLNSKIVLDDNALLRHRELAEMRDESQETPPEQLARRHGITYVRLGGSVGCLSNGAGLAMATLDLLRSHGVRPANFVDIGKGAGVDRVVQGLHLARNNSAEAIIVNIFGSVTRCDEIALGLITGCEELAVSVPVVIRLEGPAPEEGRDLIARAVNAHLRPILYLASSLRAAVEQTVALVKGHQREARDG
jgi:succinyl-CoA synthetase beta subunit